MSKTMTEPHTLYQLKISLRDIRPPIWRRVLVKDCSLAKLHEVIQVCMNWTNSHLHLFEIEGEHYGEPEPGLMEHKDQHRLKLSQLVARGINKFSYVYDFGDDWVHTVAIEKTVPAEAGVHYPQCVTGKRAGPPEDCGGPPGYDECLAAMQNPDDPDSAEKREWLGEDFDSEAFDIDEVNRELRAIR